MKEDPNWSFLTNEHFGYLRYSITDYVLHLNYLDDRNAKAAEVYMNFALYHPNAKLTKKEFLWDLAHAMNYGNLEWFEAIKTQHPLWKKLTEKAIVYVLNNRFDFWQGGISDEQFLAKNKNKKIIFLSILNRLLEEYPLTDANILFPLIVDFRSAAHDTGDSNGPLLDSSNYEKYLPLFQETKAWQKLSSNQLAEIFCKNNYEPILSWMVLTHPNWKELSTWDLKNVLLKVIDFVDKKEELDKITPYLTSLPSWNKLTPQHYAEIYSLIHDYNQYKSDKKRRELYLDFFRTYSN